jgi:hypothetical protein
MREKERVVIQDHKMLRNTKERERERERKRERERRK